MPFSPLNQYLSRDIHFLPWYKKIFLVCKNLQIHENRPVTIVSNIVSSCDLDVKRSLQTGNTAT